MSVMLATLALNEMEWLPSLYEQHKDWPDLARWVFVESADRSYADANPDLVSENGLSVDGTSEFLRKLAERDHRVSYVPFGFCGHDDPAEGKCQSRQTYLDIAEDVRPEFVITVDADEFYTHEDQRRLIDVMRRYSSASGFVFHRREIWRPPSIRHLPLFSFEIVGGFWSIACCHWWRWNPGMRYTVSHNTPVDGSGELMNRKLLRLNGRNLMPQMIHLGYAADQTTRLAKNRYYVARGEGQGDGRDWYVESRDVFRTWQIGDTIPRFPRQKSRAQVIEYLGPVPEVFQQETASP